jgi:hypothetical protein
MIIALAVPNIAHAHLAIFGEGTRLFLVLLIEASPCLSAGAWKGRRISAMDILPACPTNSMCATRERLERNRL